MRPYPITVLCILLFIMGISRTINALQAFVTVPNFHSTYGLLINGLALLSYYGLWKMRKWSVFLFLGVWIFQIMMFPFFPLDFMRDQIRSWFSWLIIVIYLAVVLPHWKLLSSPPVERTDSEGKKA